jgi:hypothetical protein
MKIRNKYFFGDLSKSRMHMVSDYLKICADRALLCSPVDFGVPVDGGLRTDERQNEIFKKGYSKADGYKKKSFHQQKDSDGKGLALDLVPYIAGIGFSYEAAGRFGIIGTLMLEAWEELQEEGKIQKDLFLHWGGLWTHKDPKSLGWDLAHFEIRTYQQIEKV